MEDNFVGGRHEEADQALLLERLPERQAEQRWLRHGRAAVGRCPSWRRPVRPASRRPRDRRACRARRPFRSTLGPCGPSAHVSNLASPLRSRFSSGRVLRSSVCSSQVQEVPGAVGPPGCAVASVGGCRLGAREQVVGDGAPVPPAVRDCRQPARLLLPRHGNPAQPSDGPCSALLPSRASSVSYASYLLIVLCCVRFRHLR
jgi:hypothetical protein